jgi:hypothetical protein
MRRRRGFLIGLLSITALGALPGIAAAGTWSPAGAMNEGRYQGAAALLQDGRVLVSGGFKNDPADMVPPFDALPLQSAELYNAGLSSFTPAAGNMAWGARSGHVSVTLGDGRVLITGGILQPANVVTSNSEVFLPGSSTFSFDCVGPTDCDNLNTPRRFPAAARLASGKVLVAGGSDDGGNSFMTAELYDPATNTFSDTDAMTVPRSGAVAVPLPGNRILVAGGVDSTGGGFLTSAEIFDGNTETFSGPVGIGAMGTQRALASGAPLPGGRALVAGGQESALAAPLASGEVFSGNTWSSVNVGPLNTPRSSAASAPLADGRVLTVGGVNAAGSRLQSAEIYSEPPTPGTVNSAAVPVATSTGQRAAALKKCKKKKGKKRKKCRKKAKKLPV